MQANDLDQFLLEHYRDGQDYSENDDDDDDDYLAQDAIQHGGLGPMSGTPTGVTSAIAGSARDSPSNFTVDFVSYSGDGPEYDLINGMPSGVPNVQQPSALRGQPSQALLNHSAMLTAEQSRFLLEVYFRGYHTLVPLVHKPSFVAECDSMLSGIYPVVLQQNRDLLALMHAMCFAGMIACPAEKLLEQFPIKPKESLATELHKAALQLLRSTGFPHKPSVRSLTAYILCQSTWLRGLLLVH